MAENSVDRLKMSKHRVTSTRGHPYHLRAPKSKTVLAEVQLTPGLGRHGRSVSKITPLKRVSRVETGICGETVALRTPKKENPRTKKMRTSTVGELKVEMPTTENSSFPAHLVIKINPLFVAAQRSGSSTRPCDYKDSSQIPSGSDAAKNPLFYGQRRNIRKTKEQEMISAILELVQCGESSVNVSQRKSIVQKAKDILSRRKSTSDISKHKSPVRKGAFFLRAPRKRKNTVENKQVFST